MTTYTRRRMPRLVRNSSVAALCAAALLIPTAANAQMVARDDATGDQSRYDPIGYFPYPEAVGGDVTKTVISHSDTRIKIRLEFDDLGDDYDWLDITARFRTDADYRGIASASFTGTSEASAYVHRSKREDCLVSPKAVVNRDENYATLSFLRSCIGDPTWLRFQIETNFDLHGTHDDALSDTAFSVDTERPTWSPRIYTGDTVPLVRRNTQTITDPASDMRKTSWVDFESVMEPERTNGDIVSTTLNHLENRVTGVIQFTDLTPDDTETFEVGVIMHTDKVSSLLQFIYTPSHPEGVVSLLTETARFNYDWERNNCEVHKTIDYEANTFSFSVPRWCLKRPDWVKFNVEAYSRGGSYFNDENPVYSVYDNALQLGAVDTQAEVFSKRIYRP